MALIFDILILGSVAANLWFSVRMYRRVCRHNEEELTDRAVETVAEAQKKDLIDEGIDNILLFSVNGKTGFEQDIWQGG